MATARKGLQRDAPRASGGQLLQDEADYQLHLIYLWYEKQPERALDAARDCATGHPRNPQFPRRPPTSRTCICRITAPACARGGRCSTRRGRAGSPNPRLTEVRARLGMAAQLDALLETDLAVEQLRTVVAARPVAPFESYALAELRLGQSSGPDGPAERGDGRLPPRPRAVPSRDPLHVEAGARAGLRKRPDADTALAYRLSIEGWRALERGDLTTAARALARSLALRPDDQVTRYRQARLLAAHNDDLGRHRDVRERDERRRADATDVLRVGVAACGAALRAAARSDTRDRAVRARAHRVRRRSDDEGCSRARTRATDEIAARIFIARRRVDRVMRARVAKSLFFRGNREPYAMR